MELKELKEYMERNGIAAEITRHVAPIRSTRQAALAVGLPDENLVKTILLKGDNNSIVACILPKHRRLDLNLVQEVLNWKKKPQHVDYLEIKKITGFNPGGVPPIGLPSHVTLLVDEEVMSKDLIACTAGDEFHTLKMPSSSFKKVQNKVIRAKISTN